MTQSLVTSPDELPGALHRDARWAVALNVALVLTTWLVALGTSGAHAGHSGLVGGALGLLNLLAILWVTGRVLRSGGEDITLPMIVYAAKFILLVGLVGAVVLIMQPSVVPFLVGFSTSLPVIVGVCAVRFNR